MDDQHILKLERPHSNLFWLYFIHSVCTGPLILLVLPFQAIRYFTLRYAFDQDGVTMRWGFVFRHEIRLNYSRIQDIHVTSGIVQRWLGLADLQVQTAGSGSSAEMTIEGLLEYAEVRDFLYRHMRGYKDAHAHPPAAGVPGSAGTVAVQNDASLELLRSIRDELRGTRMALEAKKGA